MKELFDYINSNSFLTTIIGVIVGGLISSLTSIYISNKEKKERRKEAYLKEKRMQLSRKPELKITKVLSENDVVPNIEVFLAPFEVKYGNTYKKYEIYYPKDILNKEKHNYKDFYIKNIGKSAINQLDICATFKNHNILVAYQSLEYVVNEKFVEYNYCYDKKILKNDEIIIRVYYLQNYQMCHPFSCTLAILFRDDYNNLWEQPFWYEKDNLYEPRQITSKEYHSYVTMNDALDCFEHPWMW